MLRWAVRLLDTIIVFYLCLSGFFYLFGGFDFHRPFHIYLVDMNKPFEILVAAIMARSMIFGIQYLAVERKRVFFFMAFILSSILTVAAGEALLRIIYIDGGSKIYGAPGGRRFVRTYDHGLYRFPHVTGPKKPGITRIYIQGDSITYGNIRKWTDLYPYLLLKKLNKKSIKYEMHVDSLHGREIDGHLAALRQAVYKYKLDPDIIVYQWFENDIELSKSNRPKKMGQHLENLPWSGWLNANSYLYNFLNKRLNSFLPWEGKSYIQYLTDEFNEKTVNWYKFRVLFHEWATYATEHDRRVVLMIYPALPFTGEDPLKTLHNNVKRICGQNNFLIPAIALPHNTGTEIDDKSSTFGKVMKATIRDSAEGFLVFGPYIPLARGKHTVTFRMKVGRLTKNHVAIIDAVYEKGNKILATKEITGSDFNKAGAWKIFTISFNIKDRIMENIEFRVHYLGGADLTVDEIETPTNYGIETLDLTPYLKGMDTTVSIFDPHPNEETYKIVANALYHKIISRNFNNHYN